MIPNFKSKLEFLKFFSNECIENMKKIELKHSRETDIQKTYASTLKYLSEDEQASGGCHFISSMLHILLVEQGIDNNVVIGEVEDYETHSRFSHSWVEIDGKVFDPAIMHTLDGNIHSPVYNGVKLTLDTLNVEYGISGDKNELDRDARQALDMSITSYLDGIKQHGLPKNFLWNEILKVGTGIIGYANASRLRKKYDSHYRILRTR